MFTIEDIISTLNGVEVRGKNNMDRLLGAILALEAIVEAQKNENKEVEVVDDGGDPVNG